MNNTITTFMETVDSAYAIIDNDLRQLQSNYFIDVPLLKGYSLWKHDKFNNIKYWSS